ncbi:CFC_HP_G0102330.mRNA.1.CDS.1 [Saccharomyces cerevisiae]|nr:CFC_HP_G0102330.mRNA.1.CDS.1 [Saccharomyces cerevisiae]CAI6904141.1 CFC_HP_G0102330.mRNA.1.CDS.1 [Saccharomyces cerevisiae]
MRSQNLAMIIEYAYKVNPSINIEVLIHKVDGLSEDFKVDAQRDIMQRTGEELLELGLDGVQVSFYLTSILITQYMRHFRGLCRN